MLLQIANKPCVYMCSQMKVQKHVMPIFGAIALVWVSTIGFEVTLTVVSSDIVEGTCIPYGVYSSYAIEKTVGALVFVVGFLFPLMMMAFCYSRIVYALKNKVITNVQCYDFKMVNE